MARRIAIEERMKRLEGRLQDVHAFCILILILTLASTFLGFFSMQVAAEQEWNAVQTALTIFQIFIIIALAGGFWIIRREAKEDAKEAAADVADDVAREIANDVAREEARSVSRQETLSFFQGLNPEEVSEIMEALDQEENDGE